MLVQLKQKFYFFVQAKRPAVQTDYVTKTFCTAKTESSASLPRTRLGFDFLPIHFTIFAELSFWLWPVIEAAAP